MISTQKRARAAQVRYSLDVTFLEHIGETDFWHVRFEESRKERFYEAIGDIRAYGGWWDSKAFGDLGGWRVPMKWFIDRTDHIGSFAEDVREDLYDLNIAWALREFLRTHDTPQQRTRPLPMRVQQAYTTMKLTVGADLSIVKKQRHMLALQNHPDRGGSHSTMASVNAAYDVIVAYLSNVA